MDLRRQALAILLAITILIQNGGEVIASPPSPTSSGISDQPMVTLQADGFLFEWDLPPAQLTVDESGTVNIEIQNFRLESSTSGLQLPQKGFLIALPPDSNPNVEIIQTQEYELELPNNLLGRLPDSLLITEADQAGSSESSGLFELELLGISRGVHLARLSLRPVYLSDNRLNVTSQIKAAIHFNASVEPSSISEQDKLLASLRQAVINPDQVQLSEPFRGRSHSSTLVDVTGQAAIEVGQPGLYSVTYEDLASAGYPVETAQATNLHLSRAGRDIPYEWIGDPGDGFDPGESLIFYAEPRFSRYTERDVYFLGQGTTAGLSIPVRTAAPANLPAGTLKAEQIFEENSIYTPNSLLGEEIPAGQDGDRWTWKSLTFPSGSSNNTSAVTLTFDLPAIQVSQPATLTLWMIGYTNPITTPNHRVAASINGLALEQVEWGGKSAITATLPISPNVLLAGENELILRLPGIPDIPVEGAWLDAYRVAYTPGTPLSDFSWVNGATVTSTYTLTMSAGASPRIYDVSNPDQPYRLNGFAYNASGTLVFTDTATQLPARYLVVRDSAILDPGEIRMASSLVATSQSQADEIIITHPLFVSALTPLVTLRSREGLKVMVETTQAIYDAYDGGRPTPDAIRDYLEDAYYRAYRPSYVLLVGDGTSDPRRYLTTSNQTFIPPFLANVDPWAGETAADNSFVILEGQDKISDMLLGRLPVNTIEEAQVVVNKIVAYPEQVANDSWTGNWVFVADNADNAGDFPAQLQQLIDEFAEGNFNTSELFYVSPSPVESLQQSLRTQWNDGSGFLIYNGHSSYHQWGSEIFFHYNDISSLHNQDRLPIVLEMTCFTGSFQVPHESTLDESLLRYSDGGAIAVWGSTSLGMTDGQIVLAEGFLDYVLPTSGASIGEGTYAGIFRLMAELPLFEDLMSTFTLFGDPATQVQITYVPSHHQYLPTVYNK